MVGPWQVPVSDVAVSLSSYEGYTGEAMAMGERAPVALLDAPASGRLAVAEALTNIIAADVRELTDVRLSANWMAACGEPGEDADLYATVRAVSLELCAKLGITIPVGKDSLSMRTVWTDAEGDHAVIAPVSLVISAFAKVADARRTLTAQLDLSQPTRLLLIDLGAGKVAWAGHAGRRCRGRWRRGPRTSMTQNLLRDFFAAVREAQKTWDWCSPITINSDGGLLVALLEIGLCRALRSRHHLHAGVDAIGACFAEELGAVVQIPAARVLEARRILERHGLDAYCKDVGKPVAGSAVQLRVGGQVAYSASRIDLHRRWSEVSFRMQALRDNPQCAREEYSRLLDEHDPGLHATPSFDPAEDVAAPYICAGARPTVAVLRQRAGRQHKRSA